MIYQETLNWMFSKLPMYQKQGNIAFKKDFTNIKAFLQKLNYPERKIKTIHVGGTNGKGSTSHIISSILQQAGYNVGLYTSPHLKNFTERIKINGKEIPRDDVVFFINENKEFLEKQELSFFEMTVGMAFWFFEKEKVDISIIEVGLGGRLDSTNVINPEISVITNIGLDHTNFLGDTLSKIAIEKAGIIKKNTPVVIGERQIEVEEIFLKKAQELKSKILFASDSCFFFKTDLLGDYQVNNLKTAVRVVKTLKKFVVSDKNIEQGLLNVVKNTNLKGRWQILKKNNPKIICDTAHNKEGLKYVINQLDKENFDVLHIVIGLVSDKKISDFLQLLPKKAKYYFCKPNIPRGLSEIILQKKAIEFALKGDVFNSVDEALKGALQKANKKDLIYIGGSTFVVAEVV